MRDIPPPLVWNFLFFIDRLGGDERPVLWEGDPLLSATSSRGDSMPLLPASWPVGTRGGGMKGFSRSVTFGVACSPER